MADNKLMFNMFHQDWLFLRLALSYARAHGLHVIVPRFFIHLAPRGVESLALHDFARQITMVERGLLSPPVLRQDLHKRCRLSVIFVYIYICYRAQGLPVAWLVGIPFAPRLS